MGRRAAALIAALAVAAIGQNGAVAAAPSAAARSASASTAEDAASWLTSAERARVLEGEVLVRRASGGPGRDSDLAGAVLIRASPGVVFATMTDCDAALAFVPHLERCRVIERAPDGRSEVIEQVVNARWFLPRTRYVFRAEYLDAYTVQLSNVSGDLREHEGEWRLEGVAGDTATLVQYRVHVVPRTPTPQWLLRATLQRDLPDMLRALRARCEAAAAE